MLFAENFANKLFTSVYLDQMIQHTGLGIGSERCLTAMVTLTLTLTLTPHIWTHLHLHLH